MAVKKVFVLGNPRSGTTLFRLMLNSHELIAAPPECGFMQWWYQKYRGWNEDDCKNTQRLDQLTNDLLTSRKIEAWGIDRDGLRRYLRHRQPRSYGQLSEYVYLYWAAKKGKTVTWIADKNNYYIEHLETLNCIWPDAKYILIIRDGRDVACSYFDVNDLETVSPYKPVLPRTIEEIALQWLSNNEKVLNFFDKRKPSSNLCLRFEDLVKDSEKLLRRVCEFLQVDFDDHMLQYYEDNRKNQAEPSITLDWKLKTLEKPDVRSIGRYKNYLKPEQLSAFTSIAEKMLKRFEYIT